MNPEVLETAIPWVIAALVAAAKVWRIFRGREAKLAKALDAVIDGIQWAGSNEPPGLDGPFEALKKQIQRNAQEAGVEDDVLHPRVERRKRSSAAAREPGA